MGPGTDRNVRGESDRRQHMRVPADAVPALTARLIGGPWVQLLDISRRGARVATTMALRPGRPVTIKFVAADTTLVLTGAVVRSSVAVLTADGVTYHTALSFAEDVAVCPYTDARAPSPRPQCDDMPVMDVMVIPAPEQTSSGLRDRLLANSW